MSDNRVAVYFEGFKAIKVKKQTSILDAIEELGKEVKLPKDILGVKINNSHHSLSYKISKDCNCEFVTYDSEEGERIYTRTLKYILIMALKSVYPDIEILCHNKVGRHVFVKVVSSDSQKSNNFFTEETVSVIKKEMERVIEAGYEIKKKKINYDELKEIYESQGTLQYEHFSIKLRESYTIHKCKNFYSYFYGNLAHRTNAIVGFDFRLYQDGAVLMLPEKGNIAKVSKEIKSNKLFELFEEFAIFSKRIEVTNVAALNKKVIYGEIDTVIRMAEYEQNRRLNSLIDDILAKPSIRVILVAGPSSSGKTTFAQRVRDNLKSVGKTASIITMDDYFNDLPECITEEEKSKLDLESIAHLDVLLLQQDIVALLNGQKICLPRYNFIKNKKEYDSHRMLELEKNEYLIIEGIHGLNPKISEVFSKDLIYKVYVAPLVTLKFDNYNRFSSNDQRLIRRIVRDDSARGSSVERTISRWANVRRGEEKNIHPYVEEADIIFNTNLIYEMGVLRPFAENLLLRVQEESPWYSDARRLYKLLQSFRPIETSEIPSDSFIREFIGKGCFYR